MGGGAGANGSHNGYVSRLDAKTNSKWSLVHFFSLVVRPAHGAHPRHPPRTFPLGLLGPRCLGLALFLALPHCGAGARAPVCLGGGRVPPPSSSSPRASASRRTQHSWAGLGQPSSPTPLHVCVLVFGGKFLEEETSINDGPHPRAWTPERKCPKARSRCACPRSRASTRGISHPCARNPRRERINHGGLPHSLGSHFAKSSSYISIASSSVLNPCE